MNARYSHLFQPLEFGFLRLKNRIIMGSMHTGLEDLYDGYRKLAAYFEERARGGVGLIITGGISPNFSGMTSPFASTLQYPWQVKKHARVTDAVHRAGGKIALQILHAGRYAYHPFSVAPSRIQSPITPFKPFSLGKWGIEKNIRDFANCARLARAAGYDGVEIMGSEGYFLHEWTVARTNQRDDKYGGSFINRIRFPLEVVRRIRLVCGPNFLLIYRISIIDLVEQGMDWDEVIQFARALEKAGVHVLNSGIGWHEARVPTIATSVPRAAFTKITKRLREAVKIPVVATNRINDPKVAETILAEGDADLVSLARPFLADPEWALKAWQGRETEINTCIACNQSCLDHIFQHKRVSCLVNPRAGHETEKFLVKSSEPKKIAVVGAGPAGLAASVFLSEKGHAVTLFEKRSEIGGQFNLAKKIPGKEEFSEALRYYLKQIELHRVNLRLGVEATVESLAEFSEVVIATGVIPREIPLQKAADPRVVSYQDLISGKVKPGKRVAVIGAGGIGFDVAEYCLAGEHLDHPELRPSLNRAEFFKEWDIDSDVKVRGGLLADQKREREKSRSSDGSDQIENDSTRKVFLLQRKKRFGETLGKTTGWIHRLNLKRHAVEMIGNISRYVRMTEEGLEIEISSADGKRVEKVLTLKVDQVVVCAGQESDQALSLRLNSLGKSFHRIGGAERAGEIDAARAIREAFDLALKI
jgi:2,4-dienoyl-CoA reductase (NADPH2)